MAKRPPADWAKIRADLWERCKGLCEVSGQPLDPDTFDAHHRRNKGMGGTSRLDTDTLPNLLALLPFVHNLSPDSVHGAPAASRAHGYLIGKDENRPDLVPVLLHGRRWVLLGQTGGYIDL
jgi:hypothetical protein